MITTLEQKYAALLQELSEVLQSKNVTISTQKGQIEELEAKLQVAEKSSRCWREAWEEASDELEAALVKLDQLKGGADH